MILTHATGQLLVTLVYVEFVILEDFVIRLVLFVPVFITFCPLYKMKSNTL